MGQQQLLLVVLGVIIVGIAIMVGINLFISHSIEAKRNNLINECVNLAAMAQQYYRRPVSLGGGSSTFTGWSIPSELTNTANGTYSATVSNDNIVIKAVGNEVVTGNDSVEVRMTIYADTFSTEVVH